MNDANAENDRLKNLLNNQKSVKAKGNNIEVSVTIKNTGKVAGKEVELPDVLDGLVAETTATQTDEVDAAIAVT